MAQRDPAVAPERATAGIFGPEGPADTPTDNSIWCRVPSPRRSRRNALSYRSRLLPAVRPVPGCPGPRRRRAHGRRGAVRRAVARIPVTRREVSLRGQRDAVEPRAVRSDLERAVRHRWLEHRLQQGPGFHRGPNQGPAHRPPSIDEAEIPDRVHRSTTSRRRRSTAVSSSTASISTSRCRSRRRSIGRSGASATSTTFSTRSAGTSACCSKDGSRR